MPEEEGLRFVSGRQTGRPYKAAGTLAVAMAVAVFCQLSAPVGAAADLDKIAHALRSSTIVPGDYRQRLNLAAAGEEVAVAVYRDPDAQPFDCKIDAILIAGKIIEVEPTIKRVVVAFYDLGDADRYWQVSVATDAVAAYARGAIDQSAVMRAANLEICKAGQLSSSYATLSYDNIIKAVPVVKGAFQSQRAVTRVRIDNLQAKGIYVGDLKRKFLHVEDLARRGDEPATQAQLRQLTTEIDNKLPAWQSSEDKLKSLADGQSR